MRTEPHPPPPLLPQEATAAATACADHIRSRSKIRPHLGIVLGSGFAQVADAVQTDRAFEYTELPGFNPTSVPGHAGRCLIGHLGGTAVAVFCGRLHYYEGHDLATVSFPMRVLAALGAQAVLLTNAAGGIREDFEPGDLVTLRDHLNYLGSHPLRGTPIPAGFVDLSEVYAPRLRQALAEAKAAAGLQPKEGVYAAVSGPSFETPAEVRALRILGADLVGMSTVAEAIVARQVGLEVAGLSCVTNRAAGLGGRISHEDVLEIGRTTGPLARRVLERFASLVRGV